MQTQSPLKVIKADKQLYELKQFEFTVANPFLADCEFVLSLQPQMATAEIDQFDKSKSKMHTDRHGGIHSMYPPPFGVSKQLMRMAKGAEEKIRAVFLPFRVGLHRCLMWFTDVEHGCFCYELVGQALNPAVYSEHEFRVDVKAQPMLIPISSTNQQIENAKKIWLQQHPLAKNKEMAMLIKTRQLSTLLRCSRTGCQIEID